MRHKIKRNESYTLKTVAGVHYLLPFGQMIADFRRGIKLNDTGKWLFSLLGEPLSRSDILKRAAEYYEIPKEGLKDLKADINGFIDSLIAAGILLIDEKVPSEVPEAEVCFADIGGIGVRFSCDRGLLPREFLPFITPTPDEAIKGKAFNISITVGKPPISPNGELIIRYEELIVLKAADRYVLLFPRARGVIEAQLSLKGDSCIFYISGDDSREASYDLFRSIRLPVLYAAALRGRIAIHSSSILYKNKVWLFSAPSGVGKSYHCFLWNRLYKTPLINGDTAVLGVDGNGIPRVYGCPWCGTSKVATTGTYELGGIILIRRSETDYVDELSNDEKRVLVLQRAISPSWDEKAMLKNLGMVEGLIGSGKKGSKDKILVCRLNCTMNESSVQAVKRRMDSYLKN